MTSTRKGVLDDLIMKNVQLFFHKIIKSRFGIDEKTLRAAWVRKRCSRESNFFY